MALSESIPVLFSQRIFFCRNHCFTAFVQMGLKENGKKNRVKYGCWQFDFICINESKLIFANTFIYCYCNIYIYILNFSLFHSIYNLLYVIPFILKWPYNIYSI